MAVIDDLTNKGLSEGEILKVYIEAAKDLFIVIEKADARRPFGTYRTQQLRAIGGIIQRLEKRSNSWANRVIPKLYKAGDRETLQKIRSFNEKSFNFAFAGVDEEAIDILVAEAYEDFARTIRGIESSARTAIINKAKVQNEIIKGAIQGAAFARTQRQVENALREQGFTALRARNGFGRRFSLPSYSNLIVRTQNIRAYSTGAKNRMIGSGRRYAIFPTIRPDIDGDDVCNDWERKKYIDLLNDPLPPESTHPNCRHVPQPVSFAQLKSERPDLYRKAIGYFEDTVGFRPSL